MAQMGLMHFKFNEFQMTVDVLMIDPLFFMTY